MKIKAKEIFSAAAAAALLLASLSARAATDTATTAMVPAGTNANVNLNATMAKLFGDPVIAKGNGFEIKQSELDDVMTQVRARAAARNQTIPPNQTKLIQAQALAGLIQMQLLLQKATDADRAEAAKTVDLQMKALLTQAGSQEALARQFKILGTSEEQFRQHLEQQATAQAALVRELNITVTDAEAKQFYTEHPGEFEVPERVKIEQIYLSTHDPATGAELSESAQAEKKKQIEDILKKARGGADFKKLAEQYSDDPTAKNNGGEYTVARGQTMPEIESAIFSLNTNQISDVITTSTGYHLFKLLEKLPPKTLDYDTVAGDLKRALIQQKAIKLAPAYLAKLQKQEDVKILDPDLKAAIQQEEAEMSTNSPVAPAGK